jgi:4-diphosphocytidyl-2-C-methyl-D-erythritol kinase
MIGTTLTAEAPGKINISLEVGPRRPDGYHSLASLFLAVSLTERLELTVSSGGPAGLTLSLAPESDPALGLDSVPLDERNLAAQAFRAVCEAAGVDLESSELAITKRVPIAGGMGGGSADAAAALVLAHEATGRVLSQSQLREISGTLGADVPFALRGGAAVGLGVGDVLTPLDVTATLHWVLVPSEIGLSTPTVFRRLDELRAARGETVPEPTGVSEALLRAVEAADAVVVAQHLRNDLQEAALDLAPELAETLSAGERAGALAGLVSGSGPTLAFLAENPAHAASLAQALNEAGYARAVPVSGPVSGARLTPFTS